MLKYNGGLKACSRQLRSNMTRTERRLWGRLRTKQICGTTFYRQKIIGNYIVDFYSAQAKLVIELDGGQHYSDSGKQADEKRDEYLEGVGLRVLRFSDREVFENMDGVILKIMEVVGEKVGM